MRDAAFRWWTKALWTLCFVALASPALARHQEDMGDYVVHFNAITTDTLLPEIAKRYGIRRSNERAMLTVTVLKKVLGNPAEPVTAEVAVTATNLNAQVKTVKVREIREGSAIYYIGEVPVRHEETLDFDIDIRPAGDEAPHRVHFRQKFFTH